MKVCIVPISNKIWYVVFFINLKYFNLSFDIVEMGADFDSVMGHCKVSVRCHVVNIKYVHNVLL